jgi:hypothetical protein
MKKKLFRPASKESHQCAYNHALPANMFVGYLAVLRNICVACSRIPSGKPTMG